MRASFIMNAPTVRQYYGPSPAIAVFSVLMVRLNARQSRLNKNVAVSHNKH
jgi:hypothetical protein